MYSSGSGGIVSRASSLSSATSRGVARLDGVAEACDEFALGGRVGQRCAFALRHALLERRARARQRALDRLWRELEHRGDLLGAEAEHVTQYECRSLALGQLLQPGDERELRRLALLVACLGTGCQVGQRAVWVGLEPARLEVAGWWRCLQCVLHGGSAPALAQGVQAAVRRDPVQPRT
jgi:hypothetical protein